MRPVDLEVLAAHRVAGNIDGKLATDTRFELGMLTHPRRHTFLSDQEVEHLVGAGIDLD
ncbi:hypothetical protein D3C72_2234950 [compost metagenome]